MNALRKCVVLSVVILFSMLSFTEVFAESSESYNANGEISFYGTYEYPDEPIVSPAIPAPKVPNGEVPVKVNPVQFPQTGEMQNQVFGLIGFILLISSIILYYKQNKQLGGIKNEIN